jgi:hypothetical protein
LDATKILAYDSSLLSDSVPPAPRQFSWKSKFQRKGSLQSPDVFEPNSCSHGQVLLSPAGVFLFRFLYFCPLEDDLDFDEETEEERRR